MNPRYRKAMRLKSKHARNGHTPWCRCPEFWWSLVYALSKVNLDDIPVRKLPRRTDVLRPAVSGEHVGER